MDSLSDFAGITSTVRNSNAEHEAMIKEAAEGQREKIKQLTDPIGEMFMGESSKELLKKGVNKAISKTVKGATNKFKALMKEQGLDPDEIEAAGNALQKGGMKGLIGHLKNRRLQKAGLQEEKPVGQTLEETDIGDLAPEEFKAAQGTIEQAILARRAALKEKNPDILRKITRKYNNERKTLNDIPDQVEREQTNTAKYNEFLTEGEKEAEQSSQLQRTPAQSIVRQIAGTGDDDDDLIGNTQTSIRGFARKAMNLNTDAEEAVSGAKKAGEDVVEGALKKAAKVAGESDLEGGGPEDVGGDIVSAIAGAATFLGGLFSARHIHEQEPAEQISNATYQEGA